MFLPLGKHELSPLIGCVCTVIPEKILYSHEGERPWLRATVFTFLISHLPHQGGTKPNFTAILFKPLVLKLSCWDLFFSIIIFGSFLWLYYRKRREREMSNDMQQSSPAEKGLIVSLCRLKTTHSLHYTIPPTPLSRMFLP